MEPKLGVYVRMIGGEFMHLRWMHYDDQKEFLNWIEKQMSIFKKKKEQARYDIGLDTRKQLIWYGHFERMDPTPLPKIMINCKPEGRKKLGRPRRTWKDGIYTAMSERDLRVGEWNNRRQWNMEVGRRRQTF